MSDNAHSPKRTPMWSRLLKPLMNQRGEVGDRPDPPAPDPPAPDPPAPDKPDLSTLFSADEIKTKQESIVAAKAEEDRRAKLTPEEIQAEDKVKADAESADKVPEEYAEFKIPDGMKIDQNMLKEALPLFKEMGLSQAKAQQLVDLYSTKIGPAFVKAHLDAWNVQKESWKADCKADKEIGGDKFDGSVADAVRVLNTIGTPELKKVFDEYGLGNHPEFVRVFARMAKHMKEDSLELPGDKGGFVAPKDLESLAESIYPKK